MKKLISHALVYLLLPICTAMAQSKQDNTTAKTLFEAATVYYNTKDYEKALSGYQDAYKVAPLPFILFNIAQCYRFLGRLQEARDAYAQYLRDEPKSEYKAEVEQKIKDIDTSIAEEKRLAEEKARAAATQAASSQATSISASTPTTQPPKQMTNKWKPFILPAGLAVAGFGLSAAAFGLRASAANENDNPKASSSRFRAFQVTFIVADVSIVASLGASAYQVVKKRTEKNEQIIAGAH